MNVTFPSNTVGVRAGAPSARRSGPRATLRGLWNLLRVWQGRAAERRHLADLDDRLLDDMGLTRAAVKAETAKPVWRA